MARAKKKADPKAQRKDETFLQWQSRLARERQAERDRSTPIVPLEARQHGDYEDAFVYHDESGTKSSAPVRVAKSSLRLMNDRGALSDEQYYSALAIAGVAEMIERNVSVRGASMEARIDCSGSARSQIVESLHAVRMERAYTEWRNRLPMPRRLFIDMVTTDQALFAIARKYGMGWPKAQRLLRISLDRWPEIYRNAMRSIDQDDVDDAHRRIA